MLSSFLTLNAQSILLHAGNKCYEAKIEESEKLAATGSRIPLACAASALPLNYGNQTTTKSHNEDSV